MKQDSHGQPFRVLGIALLVEERGEAARLVFRYPVVPDCEDVGNLFFILSPRTMAKLFRPKKALCRQPMTISIGGTVFCLRSVLIDQDEKTNHDGLVLFSVIVALVPSINTSSIPISGWYEGGQNHDDAKQCGRINGQELKASASFLAVRSIHVSLGRLCRALEREECRCRYVSAQCSQLRMIDSDFNLIRERQTAGLSKAHTGESLKRRTRHMPQSSGTHKVSNSRSINKQQQQLEQDETDFILSVQSVDTEIHGNLARELLQVFYSMSRTQQSVAPTSSAILSARDSTVFINRHIAVPIESISQVHWYDPAAGMKVRPYHTLLFPDISASELASCYTSNQRIQQFLLLLNPRKSLAEVSHESALPLDAVLEMATYLVTNHVSLLSHVLRQNSVFVFCEGALRKVDNCSLQFSRIFDELSIHSVVSFLTSGRSFSELLEYLCAGNARSLRLYSPTLQKLIREVIEARDTVRSNPTNERTNPAPNSSFADPLRVKQSPDQQEIQRSSDEADAERHLSVVTSAFEDYIAAIVAWLGAHSILISKEQYLISGTFKACEGANKGNDAHWYSRKRIFTTDSVGSAISGETLFKELSAEGCFDGSISVKAMLWRFGLDERSLQRLKCYGLECGKLRSVERMPSAGDDWNLLR